MFKCSGASEWRAVCSSLIFSTSVDGERPARLTEAFQLEFNRQLFVVPLSIVCACEFFFVPAVSTPHWMAWRTLTNTFTRAGLASQTRRKRKFSQSFFVRFRRRRRHRWRRHPESISFYTI